MYSEFKRYLESQQRVAKQIAMNYLEKFPRVVSYEYEITDNDDLVFSFYSHLDDATIERLKGYIIEAEDEGIGIDKVMHLHGDGDLADHLMDIDMPCQPESIIAFNFDNPVKFTEFSYRKLEDDGTLGEEQFSYTALTDEEYAEILAEHLICMNKISLNMLVYRKPELAQRIMHDMVMDYSLDCENTRPLIGFMPEFKDAAKKIMTPKIDILGIFKSEDEDIRKFASHYKLTKKNTTDLLTSPCVVHIGRTR